MFPSNPSSLPDRLWLPLSRLQLQIAMLALCSLALTACVGVSLKDVTILGASINTTKVNFTELYSYAGRAKAAYGREPDIRAKYPNTIRVSTPGKTNTQYFVERDDKTKSQYISIRGTANRKNIFEDVEMRLREDLSLAIPIHAGFDKTARALYADMRPVLKPNYKTYITGHSLGGAIAAVLAIYLVQDKYNVAKVVTFGQPKFTTNAGVERLGFLQVTRVVDENDIVPMLPPITLLNRIHGVYEHVGPEIILLDGPRYVFLPEYDADRISVGDLWRDIRIANLADHHMDNYIGRLALKLEGAVPVSFNDREEFVTAKKKRNPAVN
jgi:hypothetical protein